ncbi:membrane protein [Sulfolobus acidocaldarius N8]|nr:membrane protein [Sulfolobus acidocaldarius N8]
MGLGITFFLLIPIPFYFMLRGLRGWWKAGPSLVIASPVVFIIALWELMNRSSGDFQIIEIFGVWALLYFLGLLVTSFGVYSRGKEFNYRGLMTGGIIMVLGSFTSFLPVLMLIGSGIALLSLPQAVQPSKLRYGDLLKLDAVNQIHFADREGIKRIAKRGAFFLSTVLSLLMVGFGILGLFSIASYFAFPFMNSMAGIPDIYLILLALLVFLPLLISGISMYYNRGVETVLLVPWSEVKDIVVTQVFTYQRVSLFPAVTRGVYSQEVGRVVIITRDGRTIDIGNVISPYQKVKYLKVKYGIGSH